MTVHAAIAPSQLTSMRHSVISCSAVVGAMGILVIGDLLIF